MLPAAVSVMGVSVSLLTATVLVGAGCFAAGYLFALNSLYSPIAASDDDDDDKDPKRKSKLCRRLLRWAPRMVVARPKGGRPSPEKEEKEETADGPARGAKWKQKKPALEIESLAEILEDFKMVLVVRNDLKMGKGKIAAQCSHATLGLYKKLHNRAPKALSRWEMCGQVKVVLKIDNEEDMLVLQERAKSLMLPTHITIDAGRTQIAPNSRTVMAIIGPADMVDDVTGGLKLL